MLIVSLDLETTGLNVNESEIIELGAVLWDTERKTPLRLFSELVNISPRLIDTVTEKITHISNSDLKKYGKKPEEVFGNFFEFCQQGQALLGHNLIQFDKPMLDSNFIKAGTPLLEMNLIDTMYDLPISDEIKTRKLTYMAAELGFLNPFSHRALFDALTVINMCTKFDFEEIYKISSSELVEIVAKVDFNNKTLASSMGFHWNATRKTWLKIMRRYIAEKIQFPFEITYKELCK